MHHNEVTLLQWDVQRLTQELVAAQQKVKDAERERDDNRSIQSAEKKILIDEIAAHTEAKIKVARLASALKKYPCWCVKVEGETEVHYCEKCAALAETDEVAWLEEKVKKAALDMNDLWIQKAGEIHSEMRAGTTFENPMLALAARVAIEIMRNNTAGGQK